MTGSIAIKSSRNEVVLYAVAGALAAESSMLALFANTGARGIAFWVGMLLCFLVCNLMTFFAFRVRHVMRAYFADLEYAEKVLLALLAFLVFLAPTFILRRWEPAWGAIVLLAAETGLLAGRFTFLGLYLTSAIVHAAALPALPISSGAIFGGFFLTLFLLGHFFFHIGFASVSQRTVIAPIRSSYLLAVWFPLLVGYVVFALSVLAWPFRHRVVSSSQQTTAGPVRLSYGNELETFQAAMLRATSLITLILVLGVFYWLHLRWKKRRRMETAEEETLEADETMYSIVKQATAVKQRRPRSFRGQIMAYFERLTEQFAKSGHPFAEGQTINEYLELLGQNGVLSETTRQQLARELVRARYEKTSLSKGDVQRFLNLAREASQEFRRWRETKSEESSIT